MLYTVCVSTILYINSVISFVRVIIIKFRINKKSIYFSGNQQSLFSFIKIKNLIRSYLA